MNYSVFIQYDATDHIFVASIPELQGCMAHGSTPEEAAREVYAVMNMWLEEVQKLGHDIPAPSLYNATLPAA